MWILGLKGLNNQGACSLNEDYNNLSRVATLGIEESDH